MNAKQVVGLAKAHLRETFADELLSEPRLEEIWFEDADKTWCVTLGFFRKPDEQLTKATGSFSTFDYKVVRLAESGKPISIKNRERAAA